ncbi:MAG: hypothetical protein ABEJ23_00850 [Haloarculaceae archaeon]
MGILDELASLFGEDEQTFTYRCDECDRVFEATTPSASQATCRDCEDSRTVSAPGASPSE